MAVPVPSKYRLDYALPDLSDPPPETREMVRQIMTECFHDAHQFDAWRWERKLDGGIWGWELELLPEVCPTMPRKQFIGVKEIRVETDPDQALILAWRYRGWKKDLAQRLYSVFYAEARPTDRPATRNG